MSRARKAQPPSQLQIVEVRDIRAKNLPKHSPDPTLLQRGDEFRFAGEEPHKRITTRQIENGVESLAHLRVERLLKPDALVVRIVARRPYRIRVKHA